MRYYQLFSMVREEIIHSPNCFSFQVWQSVTKFFKIRLLFLLSPNLLLTQTLTFCIKTFPPPCYVNYIEDLWKNRTFLDNLFYLCIHIQYQVPYWVLSSSLFNSHDNGMCMSNFVSFRLKRLRLNNYINSHGSQGKAHIQLFSCLLVQY